MEEVQFERETRMQLGSTMFVVCAHFDENEEPLNKKLARLLQKGAAAHLTDQTQERIIKK